MPLDLGNTILQLDDASVGITWIGVRIGVEVVQC